MVQTSDLGRLNNSMQALVAQMRASELPLKDGKANLAITMREGQERIQKVLSPLAQEIAKAQEHATDLGGLKQEVGNVQNVLGSFSSVTTNKEVSSPAGITGTAGPGAAIGTHKVIVHEVATRCRKFIEGQDNYNTKLWTSDADVIADTIAGNAGTFDVAVAGPHLRITQNAVNADVTLADGDTLSVVVGRINTALSAAGLDVKAETIVVDQRTGARKIMLEAGSMGAGKDFTVTPLTANLVDDIKIAPDPDTVVQVNLKNIDGTGWDSAAVPPVLLDYNGDKVPRDGASFKINGVVVYPNMFDELNDSASAILNKIAGGINSYKSETGVVANVINVGGILHLQLTRIDGRAGIRIEKNENASVDFAPAGMWKYDKVTSESMIEYKGEFYTSQTNKHDIAPGLTIDVSNVEMPPSPATVKAVSTTVSVLPDNEWVGLVKNLAKDYKTASAFIKEVDERVDEDGVKTSLLIGTTELTALRTTLGKIATHKCQVGGVDVTWATLGVTIDTSKGEMMIDEAKLSKMQSSPVDAEKVQAFLQGVSHNTGNVKPAGTMGAIQRQYSLKKASGLILDNTNTHAGQIREVTVNYNGGTRSDPTKYEVKVIDGDGTIYTTAGGDFTFTLKSAAGANPKVFTITGAAPNLTGLIVDYHCPLDENFAPGDTDVVTVTYATPSSNDSISTKLEVEGIHNAAKLEGISDVKVFNNVGGVITGGAVLYNGTNTSFSSVDTLGDGRFRLNIASGDLAGLKLIFSSSGSALPNYQTYVFPSIKLGSGVGNLVSNIVGVKERLADSIQEANNHIQTTRKSHDKKEAFEEKELERKIHLKQIEDMWQEMKKIEAKTAAQLLNPDSAPAA